MAKNKSLELFEQKVKEVESSYEAFEVFYNKFKNYFIGKDFSKEEVELVNKIHEQVDILDKGKLVNGKRHYAFWDGDDLTRAEFRIANYLLPLGAITSEKMQRVNAMGRYVKFRRFDEWNPAKAKLEKDLLATAPPGTEDKLPRILKDEIEGEVAKKIFAESIIESFMQGHADNLQLVHDSTKSILTALAHRINLMRSERDYNKK